MLETLPYPTNGRIRNIIFRNEKLILVGVEDGPIVTVDQFEAKGHEPPKYVLDKSGTIKRGDVMVGVKSQIEFLDLSPDSLRGR